jgi:hypothetical protein
MILKDMMEMMKVTSVENVSGEGGSKKCGRS